MRWMLRTQIQLLLRQAMSDKHWFNDTLLTPYWPVMLAIALVLLWFLPSCPC